LPFLKSCCFPLAFFFFFFARPNSGVVYVMTYRRPLFLCEVSPYHFPRRPPLVSGSSVPGFPRDVSGFRVLAPLPLGLNLKYHSGPLRVFFSFAGLFSQTAKELWHVFFLALVPSPDYCLFPIRDSLDGFFNGWSASFFGNPPPLGTP